MELRFRTKDYSDALNNGDLDAYPDGYLADMFSDLCDDNNPPEFRSVDYAAGADYMWIYATLAGIAHVIALGEQINNGFDGWAKLAGKIKKLIKRTDSIALDKDALSILCIGKITDSIPELHSIKKVIDYEADIPAAYGYGGECDYSKFIEKAQVYYIQGYEVDSKRLVLFGVRESGEIEILKDIDITKYR